MGLSVDECTQHIGRYSQALADAARGNLDARVEHCPEWDVADLVWHVTEVHWFWRTIVDERLPEPPDGARGPTRPADDELIPVFEAGARQLVGVLGAADQSAPCWTWFPGRQEVGFVTRHQVQEAAVHAWDAVHATGGSLQIDPAAAADAVDEFLTVSLAEEDDAREHDLPPFEATLVLRSTDTGDAWTVTDGVVPGSLQTSRGAGPGVPGVEATASDLLLWLYQRADVPVEAPAEVVARFRRLSSTD
jgi:uncharacterized protein (TIGR03083 family)